MKTRPLLLALGALLAVSLLARAGDDKDFSVRIEGHTHTTPVDLGLPAYPGASPYSEGQNDSGAVTLGAWAGRFGLRVQALKFRSRDAAPQVAAFYVRALAQYGTVLDCREPPRARSRPRISPTASAATAARPRPASSSTGSARARASV
jgi:hypothetical protein